MKYWRWLGWTLGTAVAGSLLAWTLVSGENKRAFLVGRTTDGHHQIELACSSCHTSPFGGGAVLQEACLGCHLAELESVRDSHPRRKFTDPANADRVAQLDARVCVTCHREHQEDITGAMGVTVPDDVCFLCHDQVGAERASHAGLPFDGCASAGCHNFHDNTALYESFLVEHAGEPWLKPQATVPTLAAVQAALQAPATPDAPKAQLQPAIVAAWSRSAHARNEVSCNDCHADEAGSFIARPALQALCSSCHADQNNGFLAGRHGMRLAAGLSPMTPAQARLPMHTEAADRQLNCASCHEPHGVERRFAAVDACSGCHASQHTLAFNASPHGQLFAQARAGLIPEEAAVSCATCHMPRSSRVAGTTSIQVEHNQNANLRPADKMLRSVCMNCHSLEFAIDALADTTLIQNNFTGRPAVHVPSVDMAVERREAIMRDRDNTYH